jgi:hypothetical protein
VRGNIHKSYAARILRVDGWLPQGCGWMRRLLLFMIAGVVPPWLQRQERREDGALGLRRPSLCGDGDASGGFDASVGVFE